MDRNEIERAFEGPVLSAGNVPDHGGTQAIVEALKIHALVVCDVNTTLELIAARLERE